MTTKVSALEQTESSPLPSELHSPLGLIAGNGQLPFEFIRSAEKQGLQVVVAAHIGETDPQVEKLCADILWIKLGQISKLLKFFKKRGVKQLAFAGGIKRPKLFRGAFSLDATAIKIMTKARSIRDDQILRGVAAEFEANGITVISPALLLKSFIPSAGILCGEALSASQRSDALIGWRAAKTLGALDIAQSVCVLDGIVTSLEAIEGTDAAIQRAFELAGSAGVVVKTCKPQQDKRLDLPSIGVETVRVLERCKASALVLEAGASLMLSPLEIIAEAKRANIKIIAFNNEAELKE